MLLVPLRTDRPRIRFPYLTVTLIVLNVLVHVYGCLAPPPPNTPPALFDLLGSHLIWRYGLMGSEPRPLTFVTHMFIHTNVLHLAGNMLFLWIFGSLIEDVLRPWGMGLLYLGGGIAAAASHIGISLALGHSVDGPLVGASGAIAAIMGLFMLRFHKTRVEIFYLQGYQFFKLRWGSFWLEAVWALLYWIGVEVVAGLLDTQLLRTATGGVAHWAHVGGFLAGAAAAPLVGGLAGAQKEYVSDNPETNVERLRRGEQAQAQEKVLRAEPGNAYLLRQAAQSQRRAGNAKRAVELYQESAERFAGRGMAEQAAEVYLELIRYEPSVDFPPEVLLLVARQLEAEYVDEAVTVYRGLALHHPTRPEAEEALLRLAFLYRERLDQPYEALHCLNEILQRYPHGRAAGQARKEREELQAVLGRA